MRKRPPTHSVLGLAALRLLPVFGFAIRPIWCEPVRVVKPVGSQMDVYGEAAK